MSEITLYKGLYPNRQCLERKLPITSFNPGDSGLTVDIGGHQLVIPFTVIEELNKTSELYYQQYPALKPYKGPQ